MLHFVAGVLHIYVLHVLHFKKMNKTPKLDVVYDFRKKTKNNPNALGTVHVRAYISRDVRKYMSTGVHVRPSEWSRDFWVYNRPDAHELNKKILEQYEYAKKEIQKALEHNAQMPPTQRLVVDRTDASFMDWADKYIEQLQITAGTKRHHRALYHALADFGKIRRFEDVKPAILREFFSEVAKRTVKTFDANGRPQIVPLRQTSVHGYFKRLASWIHAAQEQGLLAGDVLRGVKVPRGETSEREHLTESELQRLIDYNPRLPHLRRARDLFIVQCATGLSYVDLMSIDFSNYDIMDGEMVITGARAKTGKNYFIVVLDYGKQILEKYDYMLPRISNQKYNTYLGAIAMQSGINKRITSHVGRHTYACICLSRGVRIEALQRTLGHTSIKTTQIYARLVDQDVVAAFKKAKK